MANHLTTRALLSGVAAFRGLSSVQIRSACTKGACGSCGKRGISLAAAARQQVAFKESVPTSCSVMKAVPDNQFINVMFDDTTTAKLPHAWLRDNCQCPECFSTIALGRKMLILDLDVEVQPTNIKVNDGILDVEWSDGHTSSFQAQWLQDRGFTPAARAHQRSRYAIKRDPWGAEHRMREFEYQDLIKSPKILLEWMLTLERQGSAMLKNAPNRDLAGPELIEHIAYVKPSHYGPHSPVINRPDPNNVAFTSSRLGMHNDLPQYEHMAGIIFIHCMEQHPGLGGESVVADGLFGAEVLRRNHPEAFNILSSTDVYFWDKGHANFEWEMDEFDKIAKFPIITLNNHKEVIRVAVNHAIRDSHMDIPAEKVKPFYAALKLYNQILYDNAINFKMNSSDMMTLDNVRCLHGREAYEENSGRHIESSYLDWDEARCRRRRLQQSLGQE